MKIVRGEALPWKTYVKLAVFLFIGVAAYSLITYFRTEGRDVTLSGATYLHLYGNIVGNMASSAWFFDNLWPQALFGQYSFAQYYGLVGIEISVPKEMFNADVVRIGIYNTTDYITYLHNDFGYLGTVGISALLGGAGILVYRWAYARRSLAAIHVLTLVASGMIVSIRGFYFGAPGFALTVIAVVLQERLFRWVIKRETV